MIKALSVRLNGIFGVLSFLLFSFSMLIGHTEEEANHLLIIVKAGLIGLSALFFLRSVNNDSDELSKERYSVIALIILIYEILLVAATGRTIFMIRDYPAIANGVLWIGACIIALHRFRRSFILFWKRIISGQTTVRMIFIAGAFAFVVILLSTEPNGIRFTWDSDTMYQFIYELDYESLYDAKLLTFHSHVSAIYAHLLVLFKLLTGNIRVAFYIMNAMCIVFAAFGMIFLLQSIVPNKSLSEYSIGEALFMLSPWICGLSTYHLYDYYIWCLFPLLIYFVSKDNLPGIMLVGTMITFSKSTGLIVFGSVCAAILIVDAISETRITGSCSAMIRKIVGDIRYWAFLSVAIVFFVLFLTGISKETQFEDTIIGIDISHILWQTKLFLTSNLLWIPVILSILCVVGVFIKKSIVENERSRSLLLVLLVSDILFFLFNCLCITYRMPRYMDSHIVVVFVLGTVLILELSSKTLKYGLSILIIAINILGSFRSVDPLSKWFFHTINVGDHEIVDYEMTETPSLEDSIVCNREYYSYEIVLDKALTYVISELSENDCIMFSLGNQPITWGVSGGRYSYVYHENRRYFTLFYDRKINGLANGYSYDYYGMPEMIPFEMRYIFDEETVDEAVMGDTSDTFYYLYMPTMNEGKESEVLAKYSVLSEEEFDFRGWKMNCIKFQKNSESL